MYDPLTNKKRNFFCQYIYASEGQMDVAVSFEAALRGDGQHSSHERVFRRGDLTYLKNCYDHHDVISEEVLDQGSISGGSYGGFVVRLPLKRLFQ